MPFFSKTVSVFYALAFGSVVCTNLGYLHLVCSDSLQTALFANQTCYVGGCFVPFFFLMCIADLCKVDISKKLQALCCVLSAVILALVSIVGAYHFYYEDVEFVVKGGYGILVKEYGPLHMIYPAYLIFTFLIAVYCIGKAMRNKKEVPFSTSILLLFSITLSMIGYFGKHLFGIDIEIIPFIYDITLIFIFVLLIRISLLNVADVTAHSLYASDVHGFIIFDTDKNYLGSDDAAKNGFLNWKTYILVKS